MENQAAAVADAAAATASSNPYGLEALINHGDGVSYTVLGCLAIMSLYSWFIIFTKFWDQYRMGKSAALVEKQFWAAGSPKEGAERLPKDDDFRVIAESALRAATHHEGRLAERIGLPEWLNMSMMRSTENVNSQLAKGLSFLATVGSTAPFVGLFGTVYGILNALVAIGLSGQPSIDKVAGPVGEALIMTALGLAVAVPAVFGYNILLNRNKSIQEVMRAFTGDLEAYIVGGVRPDVAAARSAAPAAKK